MGVKFLLQFPALNDFTQTTDSRGIFPTLGRSRRKTTALHTHTHTCSQLSLLIFINAY